MRRTSAAVALLLAWIVLPGAANSANKAKTGQASDDSVSVFASFMNPADVRQATGRDFTDTYTVIEVTLTPKGKPLVVQPDDFLLRINSNSDSSGPMVASQVYGAGDALVLHSTPDTIGITRTDSGYDGLTVEPGSAVSKATIASLQAKMLPAKTTSDPVTGLLFFPIAKKGARDLDLVYSSPLGKLHIKFR